MPVKTYSSGMRSKLAFGLSMSIGFDFYLIDEAWSVGDASFRTKAEKLFEARKEHATLLVVSHNAATIRKNCDSAAVLHNGLLTMYDKMCIRDSLHHQFIRRKPFESRKSSCSADFRDFAFQLHPAGGKEVRSHGLHGKFHTPRQVAAMRAFRH